MNRIPEKDIEQFVRFPQTLDPDRIAEIRQAIEDSGETRKIYEFYTEFYREYDRVLEKRAYNIQLSTFKRTSVHGPVILAAKSASDDHEKLKTLSTLVSEKHKVVVRVLENSADASIQIHVINNKSESMGHTVLSLPEHDLDIVTNEHGKVKGIKNLMGINWDKAKPILRIPVKKKVVDKKATLGDAFEIEGTEVKVLADSEGIKLHSEIFESEISRLVLVTKNGTELIRAGQKVIRVSKEVPDGDITVFFYR